MALHHYLLIGDWNALRAAEQVKVQETIRDLGFPTQHVAVSVRLQFELTPEQHTQFEQNAKALGQDHHWCLLPEVPIDPVVKAKPKALPAAKKQSAREHARLVKEHLQAPPKPAVPQGGLIESWDETANWELA